ncbi:uncharacterized protein LOC143039437 [Oratosquilla oratoria]|uniref:uncharacterized protein LOC143039437 n=1 Tax=Oratosquilla oratoria TaxID=337810 RepID=UPI003F759B2F
MEAHIDTEQLISLVQERPALWDKSLEDYKSRTHTTECWREVCIKLNPDFESLSEADKSKYGKLIINRWKNVKDQYIKSVKKTKRKSGSAAKTVKNYIFHEQLSFLKVNMDMRETGLSFEINSEKSPGGLDEERKAAMF